MSAAALANTPQNGVKNSKKKRGKAEGSISAPAPAPSSGAGTPAPSEPTSYGNGGPDFPFVKELQKYVPI